MDTQPGNHATPDSLKRKRDTFGFEHDGGDKRIDTGMSDDVYQTDMATTETTDELIHAADTDASSQSTITNFHNTDTDSIPIDTDASSDGNTNMSDEPRLEPSLQNLPQELRDTIYELVAANEKRIVLGRRMVDARRNNSTQTLYECFKEAIALHPFSMTCHKFRKEFHTVYSKDPEAQWVLLVNNFDLQQLQCFSDFIQSEQFIKMIGTTDDEGNWEHALPVYNVPVILRLQMDEKVQFSASDLCKHVYHQRQGDAPESLARFNLTDRWLGIAEIATEYVPRTAAPVANMQSMSAKQARNVQEAFDALETDIVEMPDYEVSGASSPFHNAFGEPPITFAYMRWCWFDEFAYCAKLMPGARGRKPACSQAEHLREIKELLEHDRRSIVESSKSDSL